MQGTDYYSCYLSADEYAFIKSKMKALGDAGIILTPRIGYYRVLQVLPSSPAEKAGVLPGDTLEEINDEGISVKSYTYVRAMLRGKPGTTIKLGIIRGHDEDLREIALTTDIVTLPSVESKIIKEGIGYIRILQLHGAVAEEMVKTLNTLENSDVTKIILDLRACSSGEYDIAVKIADMLIDSGVIGIEKGQTISETTLIASPKNTRFHGPVVVLTNGYTSGAAELIVAGLKNAEHSRIVGSKTYGTASKQKYFDLQDGSALYLTYAMYFTPKGRAIMNKKFSKAGIKPDIKSPEENFSLSLYIDYEMATGEESHKYYKKYIDSVYQKQLEKALEILNSISYPKRKAA